MNIQTHQQTFVSTTCNLIKSKANEIRSDIYDKAAHIPPS